MRKVQSTLIAAILGIFLIIFVGCGTDKAVTNVIKQIDTIGTVTLESEELIESVEKEYEALTDDQKRLVTNVDTLKKARVDLDALKEEKLEKDCLVDISVGLELAWDIRDIETQNTEETITNIIKAIDTEKEYAKKHVNDPFKNEEFKELFDNYNSALEHMKIGIDGYASNAELFNSEYVDKGYIARAECLSKWVSSYGLIVSDKYKKKLESAMDSNAILKMANEGETINVTSDYGDVQITIEDVSVSEDWTERGMNDCVFDNQEVILIKAIVKNDSYNDGWNEGFVCLDDFLWVQDLAGITIPPMSVAWDYPGYVGAAGGYAEIRQNETKKVVIPYVVDKECEGVFVLTTDEYLYYPLR